MRTTHWFVALGALTTMLAGRAEPARAQASIYVWPFQFTTGEEVYGNTQQANIRRGRTSTVRIVKHLIDLEPNIRVTSGNGTISNLTRGQHNGVGYVQMSMNVPSGATLGSTITVRSGFNDDFRFKVVRNGIVSSFTPNPTPSTIQAGTQWSLAVQGSDLGTPPFATIACHNPQIVSQNNTSLTANLTRSASCNSTNFTARLAGNPDEVPAGYKTPSGDPAAFAFSYAPPPPSGVVCTSRPDIGSVVVTSPQNNAVVSFGAGTASPTNIRITWLANTAPGNVPAPNNEFIVTRRVVNNFGIPINMPTTVTGTSITLPFAIPGTHTLLIRARNCDATPTAPSTTLTFSTRYQ